MEQLHALLLPWYLEVKFFHLWMVAMWAFSTTVAYRNYILPAFRAAFREPDNPRAIARRNDAIERFDRGAILEHMAFPLVLLSGILLVWLGGWSWSEINWLTVKLGVVLVVFVPMEMVDYYISHLGGNKRKIRLSGNDVGYERMIWFHWQFFRVTTPLVIVFVPMLFYLAVTKPL